MTYTMTPKTLRRTLLAALLLAAATFTATTPPASEAAPAGNCIYYSDASKTTEVGKFGKDCCNNTIAQGIRTSYYTCSQGCFICYPPPR
ncbi:MAG TPA: DUF6289 family protein [Thermoanaerobaculia bacterium]|nr:DUF6289 family protein [Thermoanaerobaculia bacterium]